MKAGFTGVRVCFYQLDSGTVYALSEEYERGKITDTEIYDVLAMTDVEVEELVNVGGTYTKAATPNVKCRWLIENGKEIATSVLSGTEGEAFVELQFCNTDIPKIERAFSF